MFVLTSRLAQLVGWGGREHPVPQEQPEADEAWSLLHSRDPTTADHRFAAVPGRCPSRFCVPQIPAPKLNSKSTSSGRRALASAKAFMSYLSASISPAAASLAARDSTRTG